MSHTAPACRSACGRGSAELPASAHAPVPVSHPLPDPASPVSAHVSASKSARNPDSRRRAGLPRLLRPFPPSAPLSLRRRAVAQLERGQSADIDTSAPRSALTRENHRRTLQIPSRKCCRPVWLETRGLPRPAGSLHELLLSLYHLAACLWNPARAPAHRRPSWVRPRTPNHPHPALPGIEDDYDVTQAERRLVAPYDERPRAEGAKRHCDAHLAAPAEVRVLGASLRGARSCRG